MRRPVEAALTTEGVHREIPVSDDLTVETHEIQPDFAHPRVEGLRQGNTSPGTAGEARPIPIRRETGKGQAHNPLEDTLFLDIGTGPDDASRELGEFHIVSESPGAVDVNIFEKAYQEELERILAKKEKKPTIYLTRRVEHNKDIRENKHITDYSRDHTSRFSGGFASLVKKARVLSVDAQDGGEENVEKPNPTEEKKSVEDQKQPT